MRGINRIRHLYLEHAPHMRPYFVLWMMIQNVHVGVELRPEQAQFEPPGRRIA